MGLYIDPKEGSKEEWLQKHGSIVSNDRKWQDFITEDAPDSLPVVLIENGLFTAAGVAYSEDEYNVFMFHDGRPKTVFSVLKKDIMEVTDGELKDYISV